MILSAIVAVAENGVIGKANSLPWRLPDDLRYFKQITTGHHVLMGRKNHQDIGRPLPNRVNIVISSDSVNVAPGCLWASSLAQAVEMAHQAGETECFVIGGAQIYRLALPLCTRLYLTEVHGVVDGDVWLPELEADWQEISREYHGADERHAYAFSFVCYERMSS